MSNLAHISDHKRFQAQEIPQPERKGAQLEDGYTRIPNELLSALIQSPMTDRERRVALAVARLTYGWNKTADRIADSQIAKEAGMQRKRANTAKQSLIAKKVLKCEGAGYGLLSVNNHIEEWNLAAKHTPAPKGDRRGDTIPPAGDKTCPPRGHTPKTKDMNTSSYEEEAAAAAADRPAKPVRQSLPDCPHQEIISLWEEIMPEKRQPIRSMWGGSQRARNLSARWKQSFKIINEHTGEPLYTDRAGGIDWWGRFFKYLRKSEFLMRDDSRFFGLDWVVKSENFEKILTRKYHGGDA